MGALVGLAGFGLTMFLASPPVLDSTGHFDDLKTRLSQIQPDARVMKATDHSGVALVTGLSYMASGQLARDKAENFLAAFPGFTRGIRLKYERESEGEGRTVVHLRQWYDGHIVFDRSATITVDHDGRVRSFNSDAAPIFQIQKATMNADEAKRLARQHLELASQNRFPIANQSTVERGIVVMAGVATEVFEVHTARAPLTEHLIVRVDAHLGRVIGIRNTVIH